MTITATIRQEIELRGLSTRQIARVKRRLVYKNPAWAPVGRGRRGRSDVPRTLPLYREASGIVVVPRGCWPDLLRALEEVAGQIEYVDETIRTPLGRAVTLTGELREYQIEALDGLLQRRCAMLVSPTGSGKTVMLAGIVARLQLSALVLVHTLELLRQARTELAKWLGVEVGVIGGGQHDVRDVTVATLQTLVRRDLSDLAPRFGVVLVDETHHAPARSCFRVLAELPGAHRYGVTATPWRKDGLEALMHAAVGPVVHEVPQQALEVAGAFVRPKIVSVPADFTYQFADDWPAMITALTNDADRNRLLCTQVRKRVGPTTRGLVLTDRVAHVRQLGDDLRDMNPVVLHGDLSPSARKTAMEQIHAGATLTIATYSLLGE
ncbi:MAG: hypothetical protein GKS06_02470 [Acidobacteria bacterium]|nr:hypothetical protein [Acidobacteriota bacterium]